MTAKTKLTTEEQILQARQNGLEKLREKFAMRPHGKVTGMDTFSWVNPQAEDVASILESMPFQFVWMTTCRQVENLVKSNPHLVKKLDSVILFDRFEPGTTLTWVPQVKNVGFVKGVTHAMEFMTSLKKGGHVFLFTTGVENWEENLNEFEEQIQNWK